MIKGQRVKVYDRNVVGFITAILEERFDVIDDGIFESWTMVTEDGRKLLRFVNGHSNATKDGCGYIIDEPIKKSFYCKGSGESHYDISKEYYINTFKYENYIDICYNDTPDIEGVTINRDDILRIAKIIVQEDKEKLNEEEVEIL